MDLGKLGIDPANSARSERRIEHAGVAGHPGDKGMAAIADELWRAASSRRDRRRNDGIRLGRRPYMAGWRAWKIALVSATPAKNWICVFPLVLARERLAG